MLRRVREAPGAIWALGALLLASLGVRLWLALRPIPWLLGRFLTDDAYYYYVVARHIVAGQGSTADGLSASNGYHPLWLLTGLPFFALAGDDRDLPVHLMLVLQALLDVVAGLLLYRLVRALGAARWTGVLAALLYLAPVGAIIEAQNGLETALATAMLLGLTLLWLRIDPGDRSLWRWAALGAWLGLAILARTDIGLVAPLLAIAIVARGRHDLRGALLRVGVVAGTSMLLTAPWFLFSLATTGYLVQTSGLADPLIFQRQIEAWGHTDVPAWLWWSRSLHCLGEAWEFIAWHLASLPLLAALGLLLGAAFLIGQREALRPLVRRIAAVWPIWGLAIAVVVIDCAVRWYPRRWHMAPAVVALALAAALGSEALVRSAARRRVTAVLLALLLLVPLVAQHATTWPKILRFEPPFGRGTALASLADLERRYPRGAVIGHSDCGTMSYYARAITVVNLDGVINAEAYAALEARDLYGYIRRRGIDAFWLRNGMLYPELTGMELFARADFSRDYLRPTTAAAAPGSQRRLTDDVLAVDGQQALRFFRGGLETNLPPAPNGTFTLGRTARLAFWLPESSRPGDFVGLELHADAVLRAREPVGVVINGREVASLDLRRGADSSPPAAVPLPEGALRPEENHLALVFPDPTSPAELKQSRDVRRIGARFRGLRLVRPPEVRWLPPDGPGIEPQSTGVGAPLWLNDRWSHWVHGQVAELEANLPQRRFRRLAVELAPHMLLDPPQAVRVELNGTELGRRPLAQGPRHYVFSLPPGVTRAGRNHLRLTFDQALPAAGPGDDLLVAGLLSLIVFVP